MSYYDGPQPPRRPPSGLDLPEWVVIALVASIILPIAFCTGFVRINRGGSTATLSSSSFSPTVPPAPADTPVSTATPKPATIHGSVLGGTWPDFENTYGPLLNGERNTWGAIIEGQAVEILVNFDTGADGDDHAVVVRIVVPPEEVGSVPGWDSATALAIVGHFMPPHAAFVRTVQQPQFLEYDYTSPDLASTVPAKYFTADDAKTPTPAGSFALDCFDLGSGPGRVDDCLLTPGWFRP